MIRILAILFMLFSAAFCKFGDAQRLYASTISANEDAVKQFLVAHGVDTVRVNLALVYEDKYVRLLSDMRKKLTVIHAQDKYSDLLNGNTVLFWSKDYAASPASFRPSQEKFLSYWKSQIIELEKGLSHVAGNSIGISSYKPLSKQAAPLLGGINYGQGNPYNVLCPVRGSGKALIGCVAVACAQVMAMYRFPEHGVGQHKYMLDNNRTIVSKDFTEVYPNWNYVMKLDFNNTSDSTGIYCMSSFLTAVSASLGADFGDAKTSAHVNNVKVAMGNFWQYSPAMRHVRGVCTDTIIGLICREVDNARPVIVSDEGHCYVCDGYDGEFLHMNLGWSGKWNGYYRTRLSADSKEAFPIKSLVIGIQPANSDVRALTIELKKPDMLRSILSDDDKKHVNRLTLSGMLGDDDIVLLRQMLGSGTEDMFDWSGELYDLDISNVKFKSRNRTYYLSKPLKGNAGYSTRNVMDEFTKTSSLVTTYYNYDTMTDKDWNSFKAAGMHERPGCFIERENGKCKAYYYVQSEQIGVGMFSDCTNLRTIVLPQKVSKICYNAFFGCTSLKNVVTHKNIKEIQRDAFSRCSILEELHVHKTVNSNFDVKAFQNSNPWIQYVDDL